ncbi:hypothetical protein B0O99DRAFT_649676 [Bisporella sp. PMI_857]|nr:hypothetical protein B0O99DRAFT_649676 [Bisporella sp. PMI_857]
MSTNVNVPTNTKIKEADVNRKLQIYGIATAFSAGKVPSNEQIDIALNSFLKSKALASPSKELSAEGQTLVADFRDVVKQAQHLLLSKNKGDLLQDFIWQSQHIDGGNASIPGAPVDKDTAKQHGNEALEGLRTLGTLIISNGQFRKLLNDATILIRDIAGDAATKAASKVNPSEEQLSQIDRPAADNTWHDTPDLSSGNIKNQFKTSFNKNAPVTTGDLKDAAGNASEQANPDGSRDPADAANYAQHDQQQGTSTGVDAQAGVQAGINTLNERSNDSNIKEDSKEQARIHKERTQHYLRSKMPEDRRDQTIWRLRKMVVEVQGHPDYAQAINTLLTLAETYAGHANTVANQSTGSVKGAHADSSLKKAENDLKTLIERFANGTSTNDFFDAINQIYRDADRDPELKSWHLLLRERYRNHTDRIVDEVKFLAGQFDKDPLNKQFAASVNKLFQDLGNDENGKPTFKPHLNVRYVPIPRIEVSDPTIDVVVENLVIESNNLMPNVLEVANDNYFKWGRAGSKSKNKNSIQLSVSGIQMDLRDVAYYVKRKQGFPSISDLGVADILLGGSGLSFKLKLSTADKNDRQNFFKIDKVDVDVKNFNIKLKQSKHKLLFAVAKPIMLKVLRPALQKAIEKQEIKQNPENAPNIYNRYATAAQKKFLEGKKKAEQIKERTKDTKVNTAITTQDSIFPDIHLPGGISSKATEYRELALKGEEWRSPIFSWVQLPHLRTSPATTEVTRKPHSATSASNQSLHDPSAQAVSQTNGGPTSSGHPGHGGVTSTAPPTNGNTNGFSKRVDQAFSNGQTTDKARDIPHSSNNFAIAGGS